jgi:hypothetical protein
MIMNQFTFGADSLIGRRAKSCGRASREPGGLGWVSRGQVSPHKLPLGI